MEKRNCVHAACEVTDYIRSKIMTEVAMLVVSLTSEKHLTP